MPLWREMYSNQFSDGTLIYEKMNKEEWIDVLDSAYEKAQKDYYQAEHRTPEEYTALLCMNMFNYLSSAIKEL